MLIMQRMRMMSLTEFIPSNLQQLSASKSSCYFASFLSVIEDPSSSADKLLVFISVSNK